VEAYIPRHDTVTSVARRPWGPDDVSDHDVVHSCTAALMCLEGRAVWREQSS